MICLCCCVPCLLLCPFSVVVSLVCCCVPCLWLCPLSVVVSLACWALLPPFVVRLMDFISKRSSDVIQNVEGGCSWVTISGIGCVHISVQCPSSPCRWLQSPRFLAWGGASTCYTCRVKTSLKPPLSFWINAVCLNGTFQSNTPIPWISIFISPVCISEPPFILFFFCFFFFFCFYFMPVVWSEFNTR